VPNRIDQRLQDAAYLFRTLASNLRIDSSCAERGPSGPRQSKIANKQNSSKPTKSWWFKRITDDMHIQAAIAGTSSMRYAMEKRLPTEVRASNGTQFTAFKSGRSCNNQNLRLALNSTSSCVNPRFVGPTRTKIGMFRQYCLPITTLLKPSLITEFVSNS